MRCRLHDSKPVQTPAVGLPNNRVEMGKAFEVCGCDLAGPLYLKDESKVWVVLFTCAVYRAVHLEIVPTLSTNDFLLALRRMISRRGKIKTLYSDNGTNFVGAWRLIDAADVENALKLQWIFNVPNAPWWGGFFERLVGVMKKLLKKSLGKASLSLDELTTVLIEVEGTMNQRPITYVYDDPMELQPLTPLMFIQENTSVAVPELDAVDEQHLTRRVRYLHEVRTQLKDRFRKEYLSSLLMHSSKATKPIEEGELVWIVSDEKRVNWVLGRVIECFPGKDGVVRAARIKTQHGELLRPVQKLCKMELGCRFEGLESDNISNDFDDKVSTTVDTGGVDSDISLPSSSTNVTTSVPPPVVHSRSGRCIKKPDVLNL